MKITHDQATPRRGIPRRASLAAVAFLCLTVVLIKGCAKPPVEPLTFASPEATVQALIDAIRADKVDGMLAVLGSEGEPIISSGDEVADRNGRQKFLSLYDEKHVLVDADANSKTLVIGPQDWPFPVPLVRKGNMWFFDSEAGREELLNRRIGRNELDAIEVCEAIGDAQRDYALLAPDNNGVHEYAQKFASDQGKRNGLYWPTTEGEKPSPLGDLIADAAAQGYRRKEQGPAPYHGYYYRILTAQGPTAPGGAMDYIVNGKMMLGFAVVAYPSEYNNSGIMSFLMGADGLVYQKDLGKDSAKVATAMKAYDPGDGWKKVEEKKPEGNTAGAK